MADLNDKELKLAAEAMFKAWYEKTPLSMDWTKGNQPMWIAAARAAAPFLQLPWDEPTDDETYAVNSKGSSYLQAPHEMVRALLRRFVSNRNRSLLPNPNPRRDAILRAMEGSGVARPFIEKYADVILAALDEVK